VDTWLTVASCVIALASLGATILVARGNWTRTDRREWQQWRERVDADRASVDKRISDAVHGRLRIAMHMKFEDEMRSKLEEHSLRIHDRLSKIEFRDFQNEIRAWMRGK